MSFIKLSDGRETKMHMLAESACNDCGDYAEVEIEKCFSDGDTYSTSVLLFKSEEDAGQYARDFWENHINEDRSEAVELIGAETLISWALGELAGPGSAKVASLEEWLDLYLDAPEEHFEAGWTVDAIGKNIVDIIGFTPTVAYTMG